METVMRLTLFLALGIAFGNAFFLNEISEDRKNVLKCQRNYRLGDHCHDDEQVVSCMKAINPENPRNLRHRDRLMKLAEDRMNKCPGFVGKETCLVSERIKCNQHITDRKLIGDQSICQEVQLAKDCLGNSLNDSCKNEVVRNEVSMLENIDRECKSGNFNGGPCGDRTIQACYNKAFYIDNNWVVFKCNATFLAEGYACLSTLETKCTTEHQQEQIKSARDHLKDRCEE